MNYCQNRSLQKTSTSSIFYSEVVKTRSQLASLGYTKLLIAHITSEISNKSLGKLCKSFAREFTQGHQFKKISTPEGIPALKQSYAKQLILIALSGTELTPPHRV